MPGGHQLARFLKKKVTRISLGLSLKTEKSTVKADKGAVVDNRLQSSTIDLQRPRSTLVTAKADKDAVVDNRLRSTLITVKADKGAVVNNQLRKGAT